MNSNFPKDLSIHPSAPSSYLSSVVGKGDVLFDNASSIVSSQNTDIEVYGIAGRIWEATYAMIFYLNPPATVILEPQCSISDANHDGAVVELGAGTGYLGLNIVQILSTKHHKIRSHPRSVVLSDLEDVCHLLERNCSTKILPSGVKLTIQPLAWGNLVHGRNLADKLVNNSTISTDANALLSHIICSDLVYSPDLFAPLLRSLLQLSSPPFSSLAQPVQIIFSYMIRSLPKETPFWSAFGAWFDFSPVFIRQKPPSPAGWKRFGDHAENPYFIFIATRKPQSLSWAVPDDIELMRRENDAFETLLMMNMLCGE